VNTTTASRTIDGVEIPAAGRWEIDQAHSSVEFSVRHLMISKVRGRFSKFAGAIHVADRPEDSWVELSIDAASIDTREASRDEHLRSPDFLDVERHPTLTFKSTGFRPRKTGPSSSPET
jgi:polyisoprenoid-binding protein YceI